MRRVILNWTVLLLATGTAVAAVPLQGKAAGKADAALLERVKTHGGIKTGGVGMVSSAAGPKVIVAVGTAEVFGSNPEDVSEGTKAAELDARVRMAAFVMGETVSVVTRSTSELKMAGGQSPQVTEKYDEKVSGTMQHDMVGVRLIGTWLVPQTAAVYAAVIIDTDLLKATPDVPDGFPVFPRVISTQGVAPRTTDSSADLERAIKDAVLKAQWSAGGATVHSVRQRGTGRAFESFEQVRACGWVDSFTILREWRDEAGHHVEIQAVVVTDPLRGLGSSSTAPAAAKPAVRQMSVSANRGN